MPEPTVEDFVRLHERVIQRSGGAPGLYAAAGGAAGPSPGQAFTESDAYKGWMSQFKDGGPSSATPVPVRSGAIEAKFSIAQAGRGARALVTAADASAGGLVPPDYRGLLEPGRVRPLTLRNLVAVIATTSDAAEWAREVSRIAAAAPVAEATALTGTSGTKPEGGLVFERMVSPLRTFAIWTAATKRIIADATGLRAYIDGYLAEDIALEIEDQMVAGPGTGETFTGVLTDTAVPAVGPPGAQQSMLDVLRAGLRRVRLDGRTQANGIVMHPTDTEVLDLLKRNNEVNNLMLDPTGAIQRTLWGVPIVESDAVPAGTAIVGDWRRAVLFEKGSLEVSIGVVADDFIRNIVRVLGEMRAAFAILRPTAFCEVDLAA